MPDPGYNSGDPPPLWVWIIGLSLIIIVLAWWQTQTTRSQRFRSANGLESGGVQLGSGIKESN